MYNKPLVAVMMLLQVVYCIAQDCSPPIVNSITAQGLNTAVSTWINVNTSSPESYIIRYNPKDISLGDQTIIGNISQESVTLTDLLPGQDYQFYIKAVCSQGESDWNGPYQFKTSIDNTTACNLNLAIRDNACPAIDNFTIIATDITANQHLESVKLIIEHPWPADLDISLVSPADQRIKLVQHQGIFTQNFGNPNNTTCDESTIFNDLACDKLMNGATTLIESFKSVDPLADLSGELNGTWTLEVCDRAAGDIGIIRQCELVFSEISCEVPDIISIDKLSENTATLTWADTLACNRILINYGPLGFNINEGTLVYIECSEANNFQIEELLPDTEYECYIANECSEMDISPFSCSYTFKTLCAKSGVVETFDNLSACSPFCLNPCDLDIQWTNTIEDDVDWISSTSIFSNETSSVDQGVFGIGEYILLQDDRDICNSSAIGTLESPCIYVLDDENNCHFHFYHYLIGNGTSITIEVINTSTLQVSSLGTITEHHGDKWNDTTIDLSEFKGKTIKLLINGTNSSADFGLVAIDQLTLLEGLDPYHPSLTYYLDDDKDGYGSTDNPVYGCLEDLPTINLAALANDCDDSNSGINPGADEQPCNGIDENCNGLTDDLAASNMAYTITNISPNTCENFNDGSITLSITGGTQPYDVIWNHDDSGTTISNLINGTYTAIIRDAVGCAITTEPITIFNIYQVPFTVLSLNNPDCLGVPNGSISIAVGLPEDEYTIQWSSGQSTTTLTALESGTYEATITTNDGCRSTLDPIQLEPNTSVLASVQFKRDVDCAGGNNGRITLAAVNGLPLNYTWEDGVVGSERAGLFAGEYTVTITDPQTNCFEVISDITIEEPDTLTYSIDNIFQNLCFDDENGAIFISVSGGTEPYSYNWSNGGFTDNILRLQGGQYQVTISDSRGCSIVSDLIDIANPDEIQITVEALGPTKCINSSNGFIDISALGGNGSLAYQWNTIPLTFTEDIIDVKSSTYSVTVVDEVGCKQVLRNIALETEGIVLSAQTSILDNVQCHGDSTAAIIAILEEGDAPYDYNWSSGTKHITNELQDTLQGLPSGSYDVTITDSSGCTSVANTINLSQPEAITHTIDSIQQVLCAFDSSGWINIDIHNAVEPITIAWSDNLGNDTLLQQLPAGEYSATVIDDNGCDYQINPITLTEPSPLTLEIEPTHVSLSSLGSIAYVIGGGSGPYSLVVNAQEEAVTGSITDLTIGDYTLIFEDNNGCILDTLITITMSSSTYNLGDQVFQISPNPTSGRVTIDTELKIDEVRVFNSSGEVLNVFDSNKQLDISSFPAGIYLLQLRFANGNTVVKKISKTSW